MFLQPGQQIYPGGQAGVVVIQPSGAMTTVPQGYAMPGQPAMYVPQQVNIYLHFKDSFTAQMETLNAL